MIVLPSPIESTTQLASFRVRLHPPSRAAYARPRRPPPIKPHPLINMINEVNNINEIGFKANLVAALQLTQFHSKKPIQHVRANSDPSGIARSSSTPHHCLLTCQRLIRLRPIQRKLHPGIRTKPPPRLTSRRSTLIINLQPIRRCGQWGITRLLFVFKG